MASSLRTGYFFGYGMNDSLITYSLPNNDSWDLVHYENWLVVCANCSRIRLYHTVPITKPKARCLYSTTNYVPIETVVGKNYSAPDSVWIYAKDIKDLLMPPREQMVSHYFLVPLKEMLEKVGTAL